MFHQFRVECHDFYDILMSQIKFVQVWCSLILHDSYDFFFALLNYRMSSEYILEFYQKEIL